MSSLVVSGDTSGSVTLQAPAVAGSSVLTLPVATDTLVGKATTDTLTNKTISAASNTVTNIILGTPQASTSGTSIDFTGIPATAKRITINFDGVSSNGSSAMCVQLGDAGGVENTGYLSTATGIATTAIANASSTTLFKLGPSNTATDVWSGSLVLTLLDASAFKWAATWSISSATLPYNVWGAGRKATSAVTDRVRITFENGTDTFDAGAINITYET